MELTRFLIRKNGAKTFLPHLKVLHWRERADKEGVLVRLVASSLDFLILCVEEPTPYPQLEKLVLQLSSAAPYLRRLDITCQTWYPADDPYQALPTRMPQQCYGIYYIVFFSWEKDTLSLGRER